jgi:hypothetical protein
MIRRVGLILTLAIALSVSGCVSIGASLAPSTVPVEPGEYTVVGHVEGAAWNAMLFIIPVGETEPCKTARDRALKSAGGADALIKISVSVKTYFIIFGLLSKTIVVADAVKLHNPPKRK